MGTEISQVEVKLAALQSWVVGGLAFILVFAVTVIALMLWQANNAATTSIEVKHNAEVTMQALCSLKIDIRRRRNVALEFLKEHPQGLTSKVTGEVLISAQQLQQGISNQNSTLEALKNIPC